MTTASFMLEHPDIAVQQHGEAQIIRNELQAAIEEAAQNLSSCQFDSAVSAAQSATLEEIIALFLNSGPEGGYLSP